MSRQPDPERKPALLEQIIDFLHDKPLTSLSFRPLASALGVSTFTLVYHFGSRDQLISEIVQAISERSYAVDVTAHATPATVENYVTSLKLSWEWAVQERSIRMLRLLFEAALLEAHDRGHRHTRDTYLAWQRTGRDVLLALGFDREAAEAESRLAANTMMGLHYDLIVNNDVEASSLAFRRFIEQSRERIEGVLASR